jgi:hypothetical protein
VIPAKLGGRERIMSRDETGAAEHGDRNAIGAIIERQFASLSWSPAAPANWKAFAADFLPGASLYPAARPAAAQSVPAFVERMRGLAKSKLKCFNETPLGRQIFIFGSVAIAVTACRIIENGAQVSHGVEMMLLIKTADRWQIVAQAWDTERTSQPIPKALLASNGRPVSPS